VVNTAIHARINEQSLGCGHGTRADDLELLSNVSPFTAVFHDDPRAKHDDLPPRSVRHIT
jgi:hypothetical protein